MVETIFTIIEDWWFLVIFASPAIVEYLCRVRKSFSEWIEDNKKKKKELRRTRLENTFKAARKDHGHQIATEVFYEMLDELDGREDDFSMAEYLARCSEKDYDGRPVKDNDNGVKSNQLKETGVVWRKLLEA